MTNALKDRSIILLSSGLDSVVNLTLARQKTDVILVLFFDYGQVSRKREWAAVREICRRENIPLKKIRLPWLKAMDSGLTRGRIPDMEPSNMDNRDATVESAKAVWVPNRNGIFLNIAAAYAESLGANLIVTGFNAEEGATFPDNTSEYLDAANRAFGFSTQTRPRVVSYTIAMNKTQIVAQGLSVGAPLDLVWSCYHGGRKMCGRCESCRRLIRALEANSVSDTFRNTGKWGFA